MPPTLAAQTVRLGLYTRCVGRRLRFYHSLPSTMDVAADLARQGAPEGTVVLAETQTASRGRRGRVWLSQPGNLYFSVLFYPSAETLPLLSPLAGVAVARAIRQSAHLDPTIKWPNDIMVDRRKVAGILAESALSGSRIDHAVVGIGVNVALDLAETPEIASGAGSLNQLAGREIGRADLLRRIFQHMDSLYLELRRGRSPIAEWRRWLITLGQPVTVVHQDVAHSGIAEAVDETGNLRLRVSDGRLLTLTAGDITLPDEADSVAPGAEGGETGCDA